MNTSRPGIPLLLLALVGCDPATPAPGEVRYDSAGIQVVRHGNLDTVPVKVPQAGTRIGETEGSEQYLFAAIAGARFGPNGEIVVGDAGLVNVRSFSSTGEHRWTVGRRGSGPGEYQRIRRVRFGNDTTVYVWDNVLSRLSVLGATGHLRDSFNPVLPTGSPPRTVLDVFPTGALLVALAATSESDRGVAVDNVLLGRLRFRGDVAVDTLVELSTRASFVTADGSRVPIPFAPRPAYAAGSGRLCVSRGADFEIMCLSAAGTPELLLYAGISRRGISPDAVESYKSNILPTLAGGGVDPFDDVPVPESYPAIDELFLDQDDRLWVRRFVAPADTHQLWFVFGSEGSLYGSVLLPQGVTIHDVGEDVVLVSSASPDGAPGVTVFHIEN